jgi:hypothetical protein
MNRWSSRVLVAAFLVAGCGPASAQEAGEKKKPPPAGKDEPEVKEETPRKRQRVVSDLSGFELLDQARLEDKPMVAGATRVLGAKPPVILAPRLAKVHGASPVFAWQHAGDRFAFVLWDEAGNELHAAEVDGPSYTLPGGAPRLADGQTYLWNVKLAAPAAAPAATAGVLVVTSAERERIDEALAAAKDEDAYREGLARGEAFVAERVWYDAVAVYSDLIARFPGRPEAWERRATLFAQIPALASQADSDFARADALTSSRR